jgi:uncharacterized repeat protein (TIGR03803 family)
MLTTLYSFCAQRYCADGANPQGVLVQGTDGKFYGATYSGGTNRNGTVFRITSSGMLKKLYTFCRHDYCTDGRAPWGALVLGTDGNFYGTTIGGGHHGEMRGTVFRITPSGTLATLYNFCSQGGSSCTDGAKLFAGLVQGTNGRFYGTATNGGANIYYGTVFSLFVGLGPFVATQPTSGEVGAHVKILGTKLTGATSVTFNGTAATFTVKSKSEITTTVPVGATTGTVQVITPGGTLSSNVPFRVR